MKNLLILSFILCLTTGLQAQNERQSVAISQVALMEPTDSVTIDTLVVDTTTIALPWPENVVERLNHLMDERVLKRSQLGLLVYDLTADSVIYQQNAQQTMRPASVMKLVTAITALERLGNNYQFRTSLYYTGRVEERTLNGDLYCVGGMDPRFNNDDMNAFVESIRRMGVDTIRGRIIADTSMKDENSFGEGWCWDDDNPNLSPLLISKNVDFLQRFAEELRDKGVYVDALFGNGTLPNGAYVLCSRFHALDQILMRMLKESDNLYAESMLYQVAASGGVKRASAANARTHIKKLVNKIGLDAGNYKFADGSGLSLYNYVSAELIVRLLRYAYRNPEIYNSLYPSLPIAGEDGTLEKRMKNPFTHGNVRAKTGTVTGISSLAGYCSAANNHQLAFCIINQGVLRNTDGKNFQDKVCTALCQP
jgi:D-alanyl-D-alanine carboxypeptidase/D-alanyl-D-alanine-endopeptidase (penicillin-binding protein 4)